VPRGAGDVAQLFGLDLREPAVQLGDARDVFVGVSPRELRVHHRGSAGERPGREVQVREALARRQEGRVEGQRSLVVADRFADREELLLELIGELEVQLGGLAVVPGGRQPEAQQGDQLLAGAETFVELAQSIVGPRVVGLEHHGARERVGGGRTIADALEPQLVGLDTQLGRLAPRVAVRLHVRRVDDQQRGERAPVLRVPKLPTELDERLVVAGLAAIGDELFGLPRIRAG